MFGFRSFGRLAHQEAESSPAAAKRQTKEQNIVLVSKEDIYRYSHDSDPVLLLKKGCEVTSDALPNLIRHGAHPTQFNFQLESELREEQEERETLPSFQRHRHHAIDPASNPIYNPPQTPKSARQQKRILVVEPDQKSLKRLIDCLFTCGFGLNNIQPLRVPDHLHWAIQKHQPEILFMDYTLHGGLKRLTLLQELAQNSTIEQIILTLPPQFVLKPREEDSLRKHCGEKHIRILPKPVSRFTLGNLLVDAQHLETG